jgi:centrosomal protein CEP76
MENLMLDIKHLDEIGDFNKNNKRNEFINTDKINYRSISLRIYKGKAFLEFIRDELNKDKYF